MPPTEVASPRIRQSTTQKCNRKVNGDEKESRLQYGYTVERFTLKEVVCRIVAKSPQGSGLLTSIEVEGIVFAMRVVGQNFTIGGRIMKLAVF